MEEEVLSIQNQYLLDVNKKFLSKELNITRDFLEKLGDEAVITQPDLQVLKVPIHKKYKYILVPVLISHKAYLESAS